MGAPFIGRGAEKMRQRFLRQLEAKDAAREERKDIRSGARRPPIRLDRPAQPLKPAQCRAWVRRQVAEHMPAIVEGFLNEAAKGGCAHLKMASETVATARAGSPRGRRVKSETVSLLEELEREFPV